MLLNVAAIRDSNCVTASVFSPLRSSFAQAVMRNACSDRKPRSLTATRTFSRRSAEGYRKLREISFLAMILYLSERYRSGATMCPRRPSAKSLKDKQLAQTNTAKWPQPFMFQYVCRSPIIRLHFMHAAPTPVEECRLPPTFADFRSTTALVSRILPTSSLTTANSYLLVPN